MKYIFFISFFLFSYFFKPQSVIIGDSQSFLLAKHSKHAQIFNKFSKSGIGVKELTDMLNNSNIYPDIKNVFVSIGVNDSYVDFGVSKLIFSLKHIFPNSYLFFIRGSYGWGKVQNIDNGSKRDVDFYNQFRKYRIYVLDQDIGFGDPHSDKWQYKEIGNYIDYIIYLNWKRENNK